MSKRLLHHPFHHLIIRRHQRPAMFIASIRFQWARCHRNRCCQHRPLAHRWCANNQLRPSNRWLHRNNSFSSRRTLVRVVLATVITLTKFRQILTFNNCRCLKVALRRLMLTCYAFFFVPLKTLFSVFIALVVVGGERNVAKRVTTSASWHELMFSFIATPLSAHQTICTHSNTKTIFFHSLKPFRSRRKRTRRALHQEDPPMLRPLRLYRAARRPQMEGSETKCPSGDDRVHQQQ